MSICLHSFVRKYLKSLWFDGCGIENLAEFICHNENFCNFVHYEHDDKSIFLSFNLCWIMRLCISVFSLLLLCLFPLDAQQEYAESYIHISASVSLAEA